MATPGRAYWKGFLRLSLVSIAVEIYNAVETASEIHFNQIHKPTGKRINYTKTVKGVGPVDNSDIVKGYEIDKDTYVTLEAEEIEAIRVESKKIVDLVQFVDASDIDPRYFERPYYIVPADDQAKEGYLVIREALAKMKKVGIGQITMSGREHLVAVSPVEQGLVMEVIRYQNELKATQAFFHDLTGQKLDPELVDLATELIRRKAGAFQPEKFSDSYATAMRELVTQKAKGKRVVTTPEAPPATGNVVNLMDALRKSLTTKSSKAAAPARSSAKKRPRAS
jgi:DNA end-binding protein Ku